MVIVMLIMLVLLLILFGKLWIGIEMIFLGVCGVCVIFVGVLVVLLLGGCSGIDMFKFNLFVLVQWCYLVNVDVLLVDLCGWWYVFYDLVFDVLVDIVFKDNFDVVQVKEWLFVVCVMICSVDVVYLLCLCVKIEDVIDFDVSVLFFVVGFDVIWEFNLFGCGIVICCQVCGQFNGSVVSLQQVCVMLVVEVVCNWLELCVVQQCEIMFIVICDDCYW